MFINTWKETSGLQGVNLLQQATNAMVDAISSMKFDANATSHRSGSVEM
jgi:hypothetical protein